MTPQTNLGRKKVLFLCTGNSCRSQMAEAIVNSEFPDTWKASSAGTKPAGFVHPLAIKVLEEIGIRHNGISQSISKYQDQEFDLVITVCDSAAEECPVWLRMGKQIHLPFLDPSIVTGDQEYMLNIFRQVRDDIKTKVPQLLIDF